MGVDTSAWDENLIPRDRGTEADSMSFNGRNPSRQPPIPSGFLLPNPLARSSPNPVSLPQSPSQGKSCRCEPHIAEHRPQHHPHACPRGLPRRVSGRGGGGGSPPWSRRCWRRRRGEHAGVAAAGHRRLPPPGGRRAVVLDATIFHPRGGGQPADTEAISSAASARFLVQDVRIKDGVVLHFGRFEDATELNEGQSVTLEIETERRSLNSRLRSTGHLFDSCMTNLGLHLEPGKGYHFPDGNATMNLPLSIKESFQQINYRTRKLSWKKRQTN